MIEEKCILMKKKKKNLCPIFLLFFLDTYLKFPLAKRARKESKSIGRNRKYDKRSIRDIFRDFLHLYTRLRNFRYAFVTSMYIN